MSIRATNWARAQVLAPLQKLVLLALGHRHHAKTGDCNPSIHTLSSITGLSERCVQYRLRDLEAAGLIKTHRAGGAALHLEPVRAAVLPSGVGETGGGAGNGRRSGQGRWSTACTQ